MLSPAHEKIIADIASYGWHVIGVLPEHGNPAWAYSIGQFHTFRQPEVIVFGLTGETMHRLINNVAERIRTGIQFADGTVDVELLEHYPCRFRSVAPEWFPATVGFANWFYGDADFPLLQLFWPDKDGAFPWETKCDANVRALQPLLYLPASEGEGAQWLLN